MGETPTLFLIFSSCIILVPDRSTMNILKKNNSFSARALVRASIAKNYPCDGMLHVAHHVTVTVTRPPPADTHLPPVRIPRSRAAARGESNSAPAEVAWPPTR